MIEVNVPCQCPLSMSPWTELLGPRARLMITMSTRKRASDLRILRAAYRNRTDGLRITRRIRRVQHRPPRHASPARRVPTSIPVHGHPALLLTDPLARYRSSPSGVGKYEPIVAELAPQPGLARGRVAHLLSFPGSWSIAWTAVKEPVVAGSSSALSHVHSDFSWSGGQPVAARTASR